MVLGSVTHLERIAICKIGRDIAVIGDRNIWALLSQMDVVSVIVESMRKQTDSSIFAARYFSKQHRAPLEEVKSRIFYRGRGSASK
jgi:hypothetical protein